jgi:RimJ/RimL family protein N-acetyltransferase
MFDAKAFGFRPSRRIGVVLELRTARMRVVASNAELVRLELFDRAAFAAALAAEVPPDWPPDEAADAGPWFLEQLEEAGPAGEGWYGFYGVALDGVQPVLVGGGGTLGPPRVGSVEIGYSVLPGYQRRGYALEMMTAVIDRIASDTRVREITAETDSGNVASRRLLERLGFAETGAGREPGSLHLARPASTPGP